jgi:hypothetical protein
MVTFISYSDCFELRGRPGSAGDRDEIDKHSKRDIYLRWPEY